MTKGMGPFGGKTASEHSQRTAPNAKGVVHHRHAPHAWKSASMAAVTVVIAAIYSHVSQFALSPVYGSVPASFYHRPGIMIAGLIGWLGMKWIKALCFGRPSPLLPVLAWSIPIVQYFLFQQSSQLGPVLGPLVTELCTLYPLVALSATSVAMFLDELNLSHYSGLIAKHGKFLGSYVLFTTAVKIAGDSLPKYIGSSIVMTRTGLQFGIAVIYSLNFPSKWLLFAIPSLMFSAGLNIHVPTGAATARLNSSLQSDNYVLLHRQDSLTGYMSVLENTKLNFRVMRCDHSLLGGEWIPPPDMAPQLVRDPIYAVFTMLEAVRLIKADNGKPRNAGPGTSALVM